MDLASNVFDTALIFEGGGYRGAYTAAVANTLLDEGIYFDFVCGVSAGASHTINYLSRDRWRVKESFMARGDRKRMGGIWSFLRGRGYFNADYLYRGALQEGLCPFDWETFSQNPARMAIEAFERDTGKAKIFGREDIGSELELIDCVRASSTLPLLMREQELDGSLFLDGGLCEGAGIALDVAEAAGFEKFFVVLTRPKGYRKEPLGDAERKAIAKLAAGRPYLKNALLTRAERYNAVLDKLDALEEAGKAYIFRPEEMPVTRETLEFDRLQAAYDMGLRQARREASAMRDFVFKQ